MMVQGILHSSQLTDLFSGDGRSSSRLGLRDRREFDRKVRSGEIEKLSRYWYADASAPSEVKRALTLGGRPTCNSAVGYYGVWKWPFSELHIAMRRGQQIRRSSGAIAHRWLDAWPDDEPILPLELALAHAAYCQPVAHVAAMLESALHIGALTMDTAQDIVGSLPVKRANQLRRLRTDAGSGTETVVRRWFESRHVRVRSQVEIDGVGRVDLVVGDSWIIECDSNEFHTSPAAIERDKQRDLRAQRLGYVVTRLTWRQVFLEWDRTSRILAEMLARRVHRRRL